MDATLLRSLAIISTE